MWFLGVLIGLGIGSAFKSFSGALLLAGIGGVIGAIFGSSRKTSDSSEMAELQATVAQLQARIRAVEERLAERGAPAEPGVVREWAASPARSSEAALSVAADRWTEPLPKQADAVAPAPPPPLGPEVPVPEARPAPEARSPDSALESGPLPEAPLPMAPMPETDPPRDVPPARPARKTTPKAAPPEPAMSLRERLPGPVRDLIFGGNVLVRLGVLILFIGLAFLLRYTAERVTVPIELRYVGVALTGAGLLVAGWLLRYRRPEYALVLQGGGIGVFYLTTLAAMKLHPLLPPEAGFVFMTLVAVLGAALAVLQNAQILAVIAALEGFATPALVSTGSGNVAALMSYLLVLDIGIAAVAWFRAWRPLNLIAFVATSTLIGTWAKSGYHDGLFGTVQPFLITFLLLFTFIGLRFAARSLRDAEFAPDEPLSAQAGRALRVARVDSALVFGTPMTAFGLQYLLMRPWEHGAAFAAIVFGLFYLLLARLVWSPGRAAYALLAEAYAIVGVIFGTLAIPLGLEGQWTGAAWAVEGAGMYWLGVRQRRGYARAFAFLVLAGATFKLVASLGINPGSSGPLLTGPLVGPLLLALSAFAIWRLNRRSEEVLGNEKAAGGLMPWLGVAALTLMPWLSWTPSWAAVASALLSVAVFAVGARFGLPVLRSIAGCQQGIAVAGFMLSLHRAHGPGEALLESGGAGLPGAVLIAVSLLGTAGWGVNQIRRLALACGRPPRWSPAGAVGMVVGLWLLHLASLFSIDLEAAALWWPLTATLALGVALRIGHGPLAAGAIGLQAAAAAIHLWHRVDGHGPFPLEPLAPFTHPNFLTELAVAAAALLSAYWIYRQAGSEDNPATAGKVRLNPWCDGAAVQWLPLLWGLLWWLGGWLIEIDRVLVMRQASAWFWSAFLGLVLATSMGLVGLGRWRGWRPAGMASTATLPMMAMAALASAQAFGPEFSPAARLGWLLWPLALAWHLLALRIQERWVARGWLGALHVLGFWFLLLLAGQECQLRFAALGAEGWQRLGLALVPALALWLVRMPRAGLRWPLSEWRTAYLIYACLPVAIYLLMWVWATNLSSPGNAAPLPYLPLLNPLEIAHWLVLFALLLWWRALPSADDASEPSPSLATPILAATALALFTGMLLRSCHHFGGVEWTSQALFASRLTQAALAIGWAVVGVVAMVAGARRVSRLIWGAGAALLGVVVVKLFLVDLADHGGLYRVISFIGVGALLLLVGYFAPVPPKDAASKTA